MWCAADPGDMEPPGGGVQNAIGFDVEHWYNAALLQDAVANPDDHVEQSVRTVLDVLSSHDVRATFFVVGEIAESHPDLLRRIRDAGHELASHGQTHTSIWDTTPSEFRAELQDSQRAIESATGVTPDGFRAPNFSLTRTTEWVIPILEDSEYQYDSSVFPTWTPMYGVRTEQRTPYVVDPDAPFTARDGTSVNSGLVEFPVSVTDTTPAVPIAGGFYARVLPVPVLERGIGRLNRRGIPANLYFHPWEFNPEVRTTAPAIHERFVSFYGIESLRSKLTHLLSTFAFDSVATVLEQYQPLRTDRRTVDHQQTTTSDAGSGASDA